MTIYHCTICNWSTNCASDLSRHYKERHASVGPKDDDMNCEMDKTLANSGFVRFRGEHGPACIRVWRIDAIIADEGGRSTLVAGNSRIELRMDAAAAQERLAEALRVYEGDEM